MNKKRYNGWTNYETWNVALWMDNDGNEYWRERAEEVYEASNKDESFSKEERATLNLADEMKDSHEENTPTITGVYADLLNASLSEVNWHEIANNYIEEARHD